MKKVVLSLLMFLIFAISYSAVKIGDSDLPISEIELNLSKNEIISDGIDSVTFNAVLKDSKGNIRKGEVEFMVDGVKTKENIIYATETGDIIIKAIFGDLSSTSTIKSVDIIGIAEQTQVNEIKEINSPALASKFTGNGGKKYVTIILPPSYSISKRKYPVIYSLAGFGESTSEYMKEFGATGLWNMMKTKKIKESIIVVIDAWSGVASSFYANSKVLGNWEEFIAKDLVDFLDSNYRTIPRSGARGIVGYATGGTGAFNIAIKYPDIFSAVYCFNPGIADDNGVKEYIIGSDNDINTTLALLDTYKSLSTKEIIAKISKYGVYSPMNIRLCYGLAFASTEQNPLIQFPYSIENGKTVINEELYNKWQKGFGGITDKILEYKENMLKLKGIAFEYGIKEENKFIVNGCEEYYKKLSENKIPCILNKNSGGHYNYTLMAKQYAEVIFPYFDKILDTTNK